eukprot:TRINITY_DN15257_c0_g2_i4.p1 TRINITY_DN15257_c0_g2~~TRINITY_DN15257_c0_g2_i4.p1  ORF type:complete len:371 (-),score=35.49 TRINITY_DN15257_c0_g2_i4:31-1143(-)
MKGRRGGAVSRLLAAFEDQVKKGDVPPTGTAPPPSSRLSFAATAPTAQEADAKKKQRLQILREILETERSYVGQMDMLDILYVQPILYGKEKGMLTQKQTEQLFHQIRSIRDLNKGLLKDLEARIEKGEKEGRLGDLFINFAPFFQMYQAYIANHVKANRLAEELLAAKSTAPAFKNFHDKILLKDPKAKSLMSLLITPIQRVPRYKLLLTELLKCTHPSHVDRKDIETALELIEKALADINEAVRSLEAIEELENMQRNEFDGKIELVKGNKCSRFFVRKGLLKKVCRSADKEYTFFLFSDLLIYAVKDRVREKYKISHTIPIDTQFQMVKTEGRLYSRPRLRKGTSLSKIGRAVQQECRDRSRMPSSA